ncbi:hypothetical protein DXT99_01975 [Pontibacter diazotrophicus]|uniref:Uncharacterized protein n=1 Tax=Pontibacter diazotrophicus TaxID=1400979 RepID=A0A3D8LHS8_9BACT|nr:hypothetical protein [Pontibacter diazotrophicus]RDV16898.1 hypothetical protein DXT99_01975 [Pontibacter diazotrophicus]
MNNKYKRAMEEEKKKAASVEKEGEKVTGGADAADKDTNTTNSGEGGEEYIPDNATKRENSTGYNELPEQSKVGGD